MVQGCVDRQRRLVGKFAANGDHVTAAKAEMLAAGLQQALVAMRHH